MEHIDDEGREEDIIGGAPIKFQNGQNGRSYVALSEINCTLQ
jgi:hypothetical protein